MAAWVSMNRSMTMAFLGGLVLTTGARRETRAAAAPAAPAVRAATRVDSFTMRMPQLGGRLRTIRVYLPPGYDATGRSYPVLYLQDAQQLFSPGPFGDWLIDETMDRLAGDDPADAAIIVGIDNSDQRWDEYGPWVNEHMRAWIDSSWARPVQGGEGAAYVEFLVQTLKPTIDSLYRTRPDRANTSIGGSSMGGLIALYAGLTRPDVFSKVMAMSSAVWFAEAGGSWLSDNRLVRYVGRHAPPSDTRFYLDVGTNERSRESDPDVLDSQGRRLTYPRAYVEGTEAVAAALRRAGLPAADLRLVVDGGGIHNESAWSRRFGSAMLWLYR